MRLLSSLIFCAALLPMQLLANEVTHAMGTTNVPDAPQRVVVLTNEATEAVLELGVTPVGAAVSWFGDPWYPFLGDQMTGVEVLGTELDVNLELVAALQPDLIIGSTKRHEDIYPQLSAIAPTVYVVDATDFQANMVIYADALGRAAEGEAALADYNTDLAALQEALGEAMDETVSVVRFVPGQMYAYQLNSFSGIVLGAIGFARPDLQAEEGFAAAIGRESIPDLDADRLFYLTFDTGNGEGMSLRDEMLADPLWANLPVVQNDMAFEVDDGTWATSQGILAARAMLRDIADIYEVDVDFLGPRSAPDQSSR